MNIESIVVGDRYTVDLESAKGTWEVTKICTPEGKDPYVEAIKSDSKSDERSHKVAKRRSFDPAKLMPVAKKASSKASSVVSKELGVIATFGGVQLMDEEVSYWPNHKKRGRPRKVAA